MSVPYLGANAKTQAICFALCVATGLVAGVFALLYTRKAGFFERALTDLFATAAICAGFVCCVEFFMQGKASAYGVCAYVLGVTALPLLLSKIRKKRRKNKDE